MGVIIGVDMVARARAFVGRSIIPQGMCLNFVWLRAGGLSSIGTSVGRMGTAYDSWLATPEADKHHGDWNAPIGSVVYYGPSPTRTDKNKNAGDIGISIGGGYGIFTDAAGQGSRVGIMTLRGRAAQIGRPYLGWADSLGGHDIRLATTATAAEVIEAIESATPLPPTEETPMFLMRRASNGTVGMFGIPGGGRLLFQSPAQYNMFRNVLIDSGVKLAGGIDLPEFKDVERTVKSYDDITFDNFVIAHTPPSEPAPAGVDPKAIAAEIVATLKTTATLAPDVDETAVAMALTPLVTKGVLDGMAARLLAKV